MSDNLSTVEMIWGAPILDEGFLTFPNLIIKNAAKLNLNSNEIHFLITLATFKHTKDDPYPSQVKLAEMMGKKDRQIRHIISSLEEKELIRVGYRYIEGKRTSNVYNFKPLIDKALGLIDESKLPDSKPKEKVHYKTKKPTSGKKMPLGTSGKNSPVGTGEKLPVDTGEKLPTNITRSNITKRILQSINQSELPSTLKDYLQKKADRLTDENINFISNLFNELNINYVEFQHVLSNVLDNGKYKNFEKYFKKSLLNHIKNSNSEQDNQNKPKKTIRSEAIPNFMKEEKDDTKENEASKGNTDIDLETIIKVFVGQKKSLEFIKDFISNSNTISTDENTIEEVYKKLAAK